jgi:hypothetical protein
MKTISKFSDLSKWQEGEQCSANFKLKKRVENFTHLMEILETQPSIFWNNRPYPCAVVIQQKILIIHSAIYFGRIWEIERIVTIKK